MASSEFEQLRAELSQRINTVQRNDRQDEDSLYMGAAAPILAVGRLANEMPNSPGGVRATTNYGAALGEANSYMEMLTQKRDAQAAARMPRSSKSWEAEQQRPGSWMSGVGSMRPVGQGRQTSVGIGRPLFQQRGA